MALTKKPLSFDISNQLSSISQMSSEPQTASETAQTSTLREVPAVEAAPVQNYIPQPAVKKTVKKTVARPENNLVMVGVKMPQAAKDQYREFFANYGLNLSEAIKNALEYFAADIQNEKVRVTVTRHWEKIEEE